MAAEKKRRRRLTDRQAAVLAAVERLGRPAMNELWAEFPDLQPSAIRKVLESLESKGLVESAGDSAQVYLGGVKWWSTAITPTQRHEWLAAIAEALKDAELGLEISVDDQERALTVFLPLAEVEGLIEGDGSNAFDGLADCLKRLEAEGGGVKVQINTEISPAPKPCLAVKLLPAGYEGARRK